MPFHNTSLFPPPWLAYPEIERYSIGWRMGYGEDYIGKFGDWFDQLSNEDQREYETMFPEPNSWKGYWRDEALCPFFEQDDFFLELWNPEGQPKYALAHIQNAYRQGESQNYLLFWGHRPSSDGNLSKSCFSQWWQADFRSVSERYCCTEQYMMAQKAKLFGDKDALQKIMHTNVPKEMKAYGQKARGFDQQLWDKLKYSIVLNGNYCKFTQNKALRKYLLSTGDSILVEASPYDKVWGIGLSAQAPEAQNPLQWRGQNLLGFALMELRDELKKVWRNGHLCDMTVADRD